MITIDQDKLEEGMLVTGRNNKSLFGKAIRLGVGSFNNHNAMVVKASARAIRMLEEAGILLPGHGIEPGDKCIAEAEPPFSTLTSIADYEQMMNEEIVKKGKNIPGYEVGFYKHSMLNNDQCRYAAEFFVDKLLGLPYPKKSRMLVLAMPIYNWLADKGDILPSIRLTWCSQLCKRAYLYVMDTCLNGIGGKKKNLFSPKTFDNRILFHVFTDMSKLIIKRD